MMAADRPAGGASPVVVRHRCWVAGCWELPFLPPGSTARRPTTLGRLPYHSWP